MLVSFIAVLDDDDDDETLINVNIVDKEKVRAICLPSLH